MYQFKFADIGEGLHEGVVGTIYVKEGQRVSEGDPLFSVETDKITTDIPTPISGKVEKVLMATGETITVGQVIYHIDDGQETAASSQSESKNEEPGNSQDSEEPEEKPAAVVGDLKMSNDLFSFDMFAKPTTKVISDPIVNEPAKDHVFDLEKITALGNGTQVDIVVIGAGPGGYTAAEFLAKSGYKTIVIEKEKAGGVCLNVGCIPTKALLKSTAILELMKKSSSYGIDLSSKPKVNFSAMQKRKNAVTLQLSSGVEALLKGAKATYIKGEAKVLDKHNVQVGKDTYTTKVIILATGSSPIMLNLPGFQKAREYKTLIDSTGALELKKVPKSLIVIGGGVIGVEFAVLYQSLGTSVTIIEGGPGVLAALDTDVKKFANDLLIKKGIKIINNALVKKMDGQKVTFESEGREVTLQAEKTLLAVGRKANVLNLDKTLNLSLTKGGAIFVNKHFQTSVSNIFALGDVVDKAMLAHSAYKQAHIVIDYLRGKVTDFNPMRVPACIYTHPEIAMIGQTEQELIKQKVRYIKSTWDNKYVGKVLSDGDELGFTKLLVDKESGAILGAHIINNNASDMISEIATLMELEGTVYELAATVHPHPSISEAIYEAAIHAVWKLKSLVKK